MRAGALAVHLMKRSAVFVLAIAVAFGVFARAADSSQTKNIPDALWVKIYFEEIDRLAQRMRLKPLRTLRLRSDELEVRVWTGFGLGPLTGHVIRRSEGRWSALASRQAYKTPTESLRVPRSTDWAATWARLERDGIREIRDDSENPSCHMVLDGIGYVVEIAERDAYRTYLVSNPQTARTADGDRFLALLPVLLEAFGEKPWVDVAKLPTRELGTVTSVVAETPAKLAVPTPWRMAVGQSVEGVPDISLSGEQVLAQAVEIRTPTCHDLPEVFRTARFSPPMDVAVELLIEPNGAVRAVRGLSGWASLHQPSFDAALKWKFQPLPGGNQIRRATVTIRYREDWLEFPWLKRSPVTDKRGRDSLPVFEMRTRLAEARIDEHSP